MLKIFNELLKVYPLVANVPPTSQHIYFDIKSKNTSDELISRVCQANFMRKQFDKNSQLKIKCNNRSCKFTCILSPIITKSWENPTFFTLENWAVQAQKSAKDHTCKPISVPILEKVFREGKNFAIQTSVGGILRRVRFKDFVQDSVNIYGFFRLECAENDNCKFAMLVKAIKTRDPKKLDFFKTENWEGVDGDQSLMAREDRWQHTCF